MAVITRANKSTDKALKEQYHKFMDMLNYGTEWVKSIKVFGGKYQGRTLLVPIRTQKVQPGRFISENEALPTPVDARSTFIEFDIVIYVARMATSWVAQEFDSGSVVKLQQDLEAWITSNNEMLEYTAIFGGRTRGIICELPGATNINNATTDNLGAAINASAALELDYDGDFRCFRALGSTSIDSNADESLNCYPDVATSPAGLAGAKTTWVPIDLRCLDDLRPVETGHGITAGPGVVVKFFVVATDELNSTITIVAVDDNSGGASFNLQGLMPVGTGLGVELGTSIAVNTRSVGNIDCWTNHASKEMQGILSNLFFGTYGNVSRAATATTNPNASLRSKSYIQSASPLAPGAGRDTLTGGRVVQLLDIVKGRSGKRPAKLYASPLFNSVYVAAITATFNLNLEVEGGGRHKGDLAPEATKLAGYAIEEMRRMPRGMLLFTSPETWAIVTPTKGGGLQGVPMLRFRVQNKNRDSEVFPHSVTTVWGVFQQVCFEPRCSAVLSGINVVTELLD